VPRPSVSDDWAGLLPRSRVNACYRIAAMRLDRAAGSSRPVPYARRPAGSLSLTLFATSLLVVSAAEVPAQDLPTAWYTTAQGLAHDAILRLLWDPRGFLWLGGVTDLARFDGEQFTSYGRTDGLDVGTAVNDLTFGPDGELWLATNGAGIYRFDLKTEDRARRLTLYRVGNDRASNRVNTMVIARDGRLWAGTDAGLFNGHPDKLTRVPLLASDGQSAETIPITAIAARESMVWIGTTTGLYRCGVEAADCRREASGAVRSLMFDRDGRFWIMRPDRIEVWRIGRNAVAEGAPEIVGATWTPRRMVIVSDGMLVVTDDRKLIWTNIVTSRVLFDSQQASRLNDVSEDSSGNIWLATNTGLLSIRRQGVTLFSEHAQLRQPHLRSLGRSSAGHPYVVTEENAILRIDGHSITSSRVTMPPGFRRSLWAHTAVSVDSQGDFWLGSSDGLLRYSKLPFSSPGSVNIAAGRAYTTNDGLAGDHISEIFEDSRKDLWIANVPAGSATLTVWRRESGQFERFGEAYGLPPANQLGGFVEDRRGTVWARLREGGIVRLGHGRAAVFGTEQGLPALVSAMRFDANGTLWIGGSDSVLRVKDPSRPTLQIEPVQTGLGATVISLGIDARGTVFAGTYSGLLSINPIDRSVRRFSSFDGLPRGSVDTVLPEPGGTLLLIAGRTLVRFAPGAARRSTGVPRCLLTAVRIGGRPVPMSESGVETLGRLEVPPSRNQIEIDLVGLSPRFGEPLEYQYRLPRVSSEWARAPERRVMLAGLAPGSYTFEARVAGASGASISPQASIAFTVLPPWYRSWWFLGLVAAALTGLAFAAHRARLAQALRTERLRARIATDLHDDIGSSLSQIAILAEVARRRAGAAGPAVTEPLSSIATTSRDLVDSMSDIVWAVNPRTDSLDDLVRRMHRFAEETLGGADIALSFSAPTADGDMRLDPDLRRELYLILKESVNNIARHSGASEAIVDLAVGRSDIRLVISDNGRGFDPAAHTDGNGVASMRKRAALFGGIFSIESAPGRGTRVSLAANPRRLPKRHYASM
jgi:signal transduction histidine kinase/ligand-binding sensor domain-containing protein